MSPTHCHSRGEIFYTYFCFLLNSKPICSDCNERWQWHLSTKSSPCTSAIICAQWRICKCADTLTCAYNTHTHTNAHTRRMSYPYVHATCPFLTSDHNIVPDELIHLVSVDGSYHQHTGRKLLETQIMIWMFLWCTSFIYFRHFSSIPVFTKCTGIYRTIHTSILISVYSMLHPLQKKGKKHLAFNMCISWSAIIHIWFG